MRPKPPIFSDHATPADHLPPQATEPNERPKRARIDGSVGTPGPSTNPTPLKAAQDIIESHIVSLRDGIATLLLDRGREYLTLSHKLFSKNRNQLRMEKDEAYVPVSARVNFKLQCMKEVEELPELTELQNRVNYLVTEMQSKAKACILDLIKVEKTQLQLLINQLYCDTIYQATNLFLVANDQDPTQVHPTAIAIITAHWEDLLKHTTLDDDAFLELYRTRHQLATLPDATNDLAIMPHVATIKRTLQSLFVLSWDEYLSQARENELCITLKKRAKETILEKHTEDATMTADAELPADHQQLKDLIRAQAKDLAKKMIHKKVASQVQAALKNSGRGHHDGASNKKKSGTSRNRSRSRQRQPKSPRHQPNNRNPTTRSPSPQPRHRNRNRNRNRTSNHSRSRQHHQRPKNSDTEAVDADNDSHDANSNCRNRRSNSRDARKQNGGRRTRNRS